MLLSVQGILLIALGFVFGLTGSIGGMVLGLVLTMLLGGACSAASNALALTTKSEDVHGARSSTASRFPVLLLSGILLPMTLGPTWLQRASDVMPVRWVVDAVRTSFNGAYDATPMAWGVGWTVVLTALGLWWGTATFRRENS